MAPLLALLALCAGAQAQDLPQTSPKQEKPGWYWLAHGNGGLKGVSVAGRTSISGPGTLEPDMSYAACVLPAAADWALDAQSEDIELGYLHWVGLAMHAENAGNGSAVIGYCGSLRSPTEQYDLDRLDQKFLQHCKNPWPSGMDDAPTAENPRRKIPHRLKTPGRYQVMKYNSPAGYIVDKAGKAIEPRVWLMPGDTKPGIDYFPPSQVIVETLIHLARSPHEKVAKRALDLMESIKGRQKHFKNTVYALVQDAKAPAAVRERAAEVLASVHTSFVTAEALAPVWADETNPVGLRMAALRGYSLILSFGDPRFGLKDKQCYATGAVCDKLHRHLPTLMAVIHAETKQDANGRDKLSPLGDQGRCVAEQHSRRWLCYLRREYKTESPESWYEKLKSDEKKGLDECETDGKLKVSFERRTVTGKY